MKKRLRLGIPLVLALILLSYLLLTPVGSLRLALLTHSFYLDAIRPLHIEKIVHPSNPIYPFDLTENELGFVLHPAPYEKDTDSNLINWRVSKHGIFYTARYNGWA